MKSHPLTLECARKNSPSRGGARRAGACVVQTNKFGSPLA